MRSVRRTTLFAKCPAPGAVKTRLLPALGAREAARLAEAMLEDLVERLATVPGQVLGIAYAPEAARPWFEARFGGRVELVPQQGADLAERLAAHFGRQAARHAGDSWIVCGSDCPLLPSERVLAAHAALEAGRELVLSPDGGGGYALVGLARPIDELFVGVPMSSGDMFARTVALAERLGLSVELLERTRDTDTPEDLERLAARLEALGPCDPRFPPRTAALLESWAARRPFAPLES